MRHINQWLRATLRHTMTGNDRRRAYKKHKKQTRPSRLMVNLPAFLVAGFPALTCLITEQDVGLNQNQGLSTIREAWCSEYTYYCSGREGNSQPYSWQTMPES